MLSPPSGPITLLPSTRARQDPPETSPTRVSSSTRNISTNSPNSQGRTESPPFYQLYLSRPSTSLCQQFFPASRRIKSFTSLTRTNVRSSQPSPPSTTTERERAG